MDLATLIKAAQALGPVLAALPAVRSMFDAAASTLSHPDQATAKEAYADLIADNDAGHARLQEKLAAAAAR